MIRALSEIEAVPVDDCACATCREMCRRPCWPTPAEAVALMDRGLSKRLMCDWWEADEELPHTKILCGASSGRGGKSAPNNPIGAYCSFLSADGRCELHGNGKPIEGRKATCKGNNPDLHVSIAAAWNTDEGRAAVIRFWREVKP